LNSTTSLFPTAFNKNVTISFEFMEISGRKMNELAHLAQSEHLKGIVHDVVPFDELPKGIKK